MQFNWLKLVINHDDDEPYHFSDERLVSDYFFKFNYRCRSIIVQQTEESIRQIFKWNVFISVDWMMSAVWVYIVQTSEQNSVCSTKSVKCLWIHTELSNVGERGEKQNEINKSVLEWERARVQTNQSENNVRVRSAVTRNNKTIHICNFWHVAAVVLFFFCTTFQMWFHLILLNNCYFIVCVHIKIVYSAKVMCFEWEIKYQRRRLRRRKKESCINNGSIVKVTQAWRKRTPFEFEVLFWAWIKRKKERK